MKQFIEKRKAFIPHLLISLAGVFAIYFLITLLSGKANPDSSITITNLGILSVSKNSLIYNILYTITDFSQGPFIADLIIGIFMIMGGITVRYLELHKPEYALNGTAGNGKKFIWLACSQFAAMTLANIFWRHIMHMTGMPTFACAFSVTPIAILGYGKPDWKKALTGIVLGAVLPVYLVGYLLTNFTTVYDFPGFAGVGIGLAVATIIASEIYNLLPWFHTPRIGKDETAIFIDNTKKSAKWLVYSRVFGGELSELYFWGSDISGIFFILGCIVSYLINPAANSYGENMPVFLLWMMITSVIAIFFWGPRFQEKFGAFSFEALLLVGSMCFYCPNDIVRLIMVILSCIIGPAVEHAALEMKFFTRYLPCVAVQLLGAIMVIIGTTILKLL